MLDNFESQHTRYDAEPYTQLELVSSLPGPRYAIDYSLGGAAVTNLAGRSRAFSAIVLLAPFFSAYSLPVFRDYGVVTAFIDTLNLFNLQLGLATAVPGRSLVASGIHALMAARDEITAAVRNTTRIMCVIAKDDEAVQVEPTLEICRTKIGAQKIFVYSKQLAFGHVITLGVGKNRFGIALMDQMGKFFRDLDIKDADFLMAKNETS